MKTYLVFSQHRNVLIRELPAILVVVNALRPLACLQHVLHDASFHCANPSFPDVLITGGDTCCNRLLQLAKRKVDEEDAPLRSSTLVADMVIEVGRLVARQEGNASTQPPSFLGRTQPRGSRPPHAFATRARIPVAAVHPSDSEAADIDRSGEFWGTQYTTDRT